MRLYRWTERNRAREERAHTVELYPGSVRQRENEQERQLVAIRQVHGHPFRLQGRPDRRSHQQVPAGKIESDIPAERGEELSLFLSGAYFHSKV